MVEIDDKKLEEKLRELVKKKVEKTEQDKESSKKEIVERREFVSAPVKDNPSHDALGFDVGQNLSQSKLESNVADVPVENKPKQKDEEKYEHARMLYDDSQSKRTIQAGREPMQFQRGVSFDSRIMSGGFDLSKRVGMVPVEGQQMSADDVRPYEVTEKREKTKLAWEVGNDDRFKKYNNR